MNAGCAVPQGEIIQATPGLMKFSFRMDML
jgi:hypothetical protein